VCHELLVKKLECIGVTGTVLKMIKCYLTNRQQIVKIGDHQSSPKLITCGVPQGSILGPLLFLVYVNNIHQTDIHGQLTLYADDTCLFYFGQSVEDIIKPAQKDLNTLHEWFQYNLLTRNATKTSYIIFSAKNKKVSSHTKLTINGETLSRTDKEKYLGLILDQNLTWNAHLLFLKSKLSSLTDSLYNMARYIPMKARLLIYNALVKPHLLFRSQKNFVYG
jgi:hypothetical protein